MFKCEQNHKLDKTTGYHQKDYGLLSLSERATAPAFERMFLERSKDITMKRVARNEIRHLNLFGGVTDILRRFSVTVVRDIKRQWVGPISQVDMTFLSDSYTS